MSDVLDAIVKTLKTGAAEIQPTLDRDDDWQPVCMYATADRTVQTALIPQIMHPTLKYAAAAALGDVLAEDKAICCAMMHVVWQIIADQARIDAILAEELPRASEAPDRSELLSIVTIDEQGRTSGSYAIIKRDGPHPTLSEWRDLPPSVEMNGAIIDPLLVGMTRVRKEVTDA